MALSLAKALYYKGAKVSFIATKKLDDIPSEIDFYLAPSSKEIKAKIEELLEEASHLFMVSAVSDYVPKVTH